MGALTSIVGGGVAGLTTALRLARAGRRVRVHERAADDRGGCSWHAGGMLAPVSELDHAEPWVASLGADSAARWRALLPDVGPDVLQADGILLVAHRADAPLLDEVADRAGRVGMGAQLHAVDGSRLAALEPRLAGRFGRGWLLPHEGVVHPRCVLPALRAALVEAGGEVVHAEVTVDERGARTADGPLAGPFVDARGLAAGGRLRPVRGEYLVVRTSVTLARPVRVMHPRYPLYVIPRGDGHVYVGATQIESGHEGPPQARSVLELLSALYALHPAFADAEVMELGVGLRPALPDNRPAVRVLSDRVELNGLFRHGYLLAPVLAETVTAALLGEALPPAAQAFVEEVACAS